MGWAPRKGATAADLVLFSPPHRPAIKLAETLRCFSRYLLLKPLTRGRGVFAEDATLVRRCLNGETEAVRNLVERFQAEVFGLCYRLLSHRQDAEDVAQEVFLRIFRSLKGWDSTRALKPWIMGIAVNRCRTWLTQRARRPELVEFLQDTVAGPEPDDSAELLREIQDALACLRFEYRTVFVLFHEQGQPYEEIALALERPVGTIKTWLHRARLEILDRLQRRGMVADMDNEDSSVGRTLFPAREK